MFKRFSIPVLTTILAFALAVIYFGFWQSVAGLVALVILFRIAPFVKRPIVIVWEFIEYIVFAEARFVFNRKALHQPTDNPLIRILQFDLERLFKRQK